jgi:hypothetical protein
VCEHLCLDLPIVLYYLGNLLHGHVAFPDHTGESDVTHDEGVGTLIGTCGRVLLHLFGHRLRDEG